jgi:hypothetical protein
MIAPNHQVGDIFTVQFVWQLPDGDFLRAIFEAEVLALDANLDRYLLRLQQLVAGRQETAEGLARPETELAADYWALVGRVVGKKIYLAYEADDGRPLRVRLATLTGEHTFFTRLED